MAKKYAELRYQLIPYTYTLAWEARDAGLPLMRALWLHYPNDPRARSTATEYLWGRDLLIAPVFEKGATHRELYLPSGDWYDWWTGARTTGGRTVRRDVDVAILPIYVRAGAIIPVDPVRQHTGEAVTEPTTLRVHPGANGVFTLYDDDGLSLEYLRGRGSWIRITWDDSNRRLTLEPGTPAGSTNAGVARDFAVEIVSDGGRRVVRYSGVRTTVAF